MGSDLWTTLADGSEGYIMTTLQNRAALDNPLACDVMGWNWVVGGWAANMPAEANFRDEIFTQRIPLPGSQRPHLDLGRRFVTGVSAGTHQNAGSIDLSTANLSKGLASTSAAAQGLTINAETLNKALLHFRAETLDESIYELGEYKPKIIDLDPSTITAKILPINEG